MVATFKYWRKNPEVIREWKPIVRYLLWKPPIILNSLISKRVVDSYSGLFPEEFIIGSWFKEEDNLYGAVITWFYVIQFMSFYHSVHVGYGPS